MRDAERGITSGLEGCCYHAARDAAPWVPRRRQGHGSREGGPPGEWTGPGHGAVVAAGRGHGGMPSGTKVQLGTGADRDGAARGTPVRCGSRSAAQVFASAAGRSWPVTGMRPQVVQQKFG